ncbi:class F sortase [Terrabacter carboxydivorans]|uniref:Sortase family protein n=1 Tax=Terrabacter carboxydivorans TaxID=619730 RepID=A0ABP5Z2C1_9MICO
MNRPSDHGPGRQRHRASSPFRGVAAAVAAALLAGASTAWLTRSSDAAPPVSGAGASLTAQADGRPSTPSQTGSTARSGASGSTGPAPVVGSPSARPATPDPAPSVSPPDRLVITRLGIDMPVVPEGVARDGEMALPATPAQVGWYRYGPRPGDGSGATVLAAHLDMPGYGVGPIAGISELHDGDVISVRSGGQTRRYRVTAVDAIRKASLDLAALFARDGPPRIRLVTCGGTFDREKRRYDENVVVTAEPMA